MQDIGYVTLWGVMTHRLRNHCIRVQLREGIDPRRTVDQKEAGSLESHCDS